MIGLQTELLAGDQLDGQLLYERQKTLRSHQAYPPGPKIAAAGLQVPENMGSVLRLADAAGSQYVTFVGSTVSASALARLRRTARSTELLVQWEFCSLEEFIERISEYQPLFALELTTESISIFNVALPAQCAFLIGSERYGVPPALLAKCQQAVHIPMYGVNGSMNVTHALAIALFEWRRQHSTNNQ